MGARAGPLRRRWTWITVVAAAGATGLLLLDGERLGHWLDALTHRTDEAREAGTLRGERAVEPSEPHGPTLRGTSCAPKPPIDGPFTVSVTDRTGAAVVGMLVRVTGPTHKTGLPLMLEELTDALGRARFPETPYDGSFLAAAILRCDAGWDWEENALVDPDEVEIAAEAARVKPLPNTLLSPRVLKGIQGWRNWLARNPEGKAFAAASVLGPEVVLTIDRGLPPHVDVRDGESGHALEACWQVEPRLEWNEDAIGSAHVPIQLGAQQVVGLYVFAPTLRVDAAEWTVLVHPRTQRLEAVYPVRPEIEIVALFPPEVLPFREEAWHADVRVGGSALKQPEIRMDSLGGVHIKGAAHLVGERVTIGGVLNEVWDVSGTAVMGDDPRKPLLIDVTCAERPQEALDQDRALHELHLELMATDGTYRGPEITFSPSLRLVQELPGLVQGFHRTENLETPSPQGSLSIRVLQPTGQPAAGVVAIVGDRAVRTDAQSRARWDGLDAGAVRVQVVGAGASTSAEAQVEAGKTAEIEVRAGFGGTLEVEVVDEKGRALPYATLDVTQPCGLPWIDLSAGTQRIDPFTDVHGRRTLRGVEAGHVKVTARFGSRAITAEVDLHEGATLPVRLVIPVPGSGAPTEATPPPEAAPAPK